MVELKAERHTRSFLLDKVEKTLGQEGHSYKVTLYPARRVGWSDYPVYMFIDGCETQPKEEIAGFLEGLSSRTQITVEVVPGALRKDRQHNPKPDDGEFENYYWNIVKLTQVAERSVKTDGPPAPQPSSDEGAAEFGRLGNRSGQQQEQPPAPSPQEEIPVDQVPARKPNRNGEKLDPIGLSIDVAWGINRAHEHVLFREGQGERRGEGLSSDDVVLKAVHDLSLRFVAMKRSIIAKYNNGEIQ